MAVSTKIIWAFVLTTIAGSLCLYAPSTHAAGAAKPKTTPKSTTTKIKPPPPWKPTTPTNYTPIGWVSAHGVASFTKPPRSNGFSDYLTLIYLPYNQLKFIASTTAREEWASGVFPFEDEPSRNWAFTKMTAEQAKNTTPKPSFIWGAPFHNVSIPTTDLSLALKSKDTAGTYLTSGSRPADDIALPRRMLIISNTPTTTRAQVLNFDETIFKTEGDQAVEGFDPMVLPTSTAFITARLYLGVKPDGKELVVYCSRAASPLEATLSLLNAGVPVENQLQVDGGLSTTCGYGLPGQYFVEPGRTLPLLMGAFPRK